MYTDPRRETFPCVGEKFATSAIHNVFTKFVGIFVATPESFPAVAPLFAAPQEKGHRMFKRLKERGRLLMNLQSKLRLALLAVAITLVPAAIPANAQQLYKGTFTLSFETKWGNTTMEPGQYTITVEQALGQKLVRVHGTGELAIFGTPSSIDAVGGRGRLTFVSIDGLYTLKAFSAGATGQSFIFPVPKAKGDHAQLAPVVVGAD
jgi:hypothetical protein